jgi:hypothetical protein
MAITAADVSVAANGDIRWEAAGAGDGPYTVLELHRYLQDLADDAAASGDDLVDITSPTPSERSTDNIITLLGTYNIDDEMAEHLYDGSITQASGDVVYSGLVVVGSIASTTTLKIIQNNTFYDDQDAPFWGTGLNAAPAENILMRCLVKTRTGGADIDGKRIRVQARTYTDTYAEFSLTMGLGNATAAIFTNDDLNNQTAVGTVDSWTVTNTEGFQGIDLNNDGTDENYYSQWNRVATAGGAGNLNDVYEYAKALTRANHSGTPTLHGIDPELFRGITHDFDYDNESGGPFTEDEVISWTGGTGLLLALDDNGSTGTMYFQLLTGVAPTDGLEITGGSSSATCDVDGTVTTHSLTPCFLGTTTGSNLIGAYGIGIDSGDASVGDQFFPLDEAGPILPPNFQSFEVGGLVVSEDRVLVGPKDTGDDIEFDQFTTSGSHTNASTTVTVSASIPSDTPNSGTIRIQDNDGIYQRMTYTGWTGTTFTGSVGTGSWTANSGNNLFISYIDTLATSTAESYSAVYSSTRNLWVRVRDGGGTPIKTFETAATYGSGGGSVTAIRTSDS